MATRRSSGTKITTELRAAGVAPSVTEELASLATLMAAYDPAAPDDRVAARIVRQARDLVGAARSVQEAEGAQAILATWTDVKTIVAPDQPTPKAVGQLLEACQRLHRLVAEREATKQG